MANSKHIAKKNKMIKLRLAMEKLQRSLSPPQENKLSMSDINELQDDYEEACFEDSNTVPDDVKEGHFAVVAVDGGQAKRFVVSLRCLTHPRFQALLEKAAEEYGFEHGGALTIPCTPSEIERILAESWEDDRPADHSRRANGYRRNFNLIY